MDDIASSKGLDDAYSNSVPHKGKLKLKSKRRSRKHESDRRRDRSRSRSRSASPRPSHRKRHKEPTVADTDDPSLYDDVYLPGQNSFKYKNPEAAFQESLFEAMADDEGASYWEGVYGQPIHVYSRPKVENEKGELEMMTDEEYAAYVRQRMYERTDEYVEREAKKRKKERERERQKEAEERAEWDRKERERLLLERERRLRKSSERIQKAWSIYVQSWEDITRKERSDSKRLEVPWPVESGKRKDVSKEEIESFFKSAPESSKKDGGSGRQSYMDVLRLERIRWHPDKALQRWGREQIDEETLQGITAVFQIIDSLWTTERDKDKS